MKYCILVVKIVEDYIISGFLPNIDIPCADTELLFAVQGCFVSFFGGVSFFCFGWGFFNYFFIFFVFFIFFLEGRGGPNGYMNALFFIQTYYNLISLN